MSLEPGLGVPIVFLVIVTVLTVLLAIVLWKSPRARAIFLGVLVVGLPLALGTVYLARSRSRVAHERERRETLDERARAEREYERRRSGGASVVVKVGDNVEIRAERNGESIPEALVRVSPLGEPEPPEPAAALPPPPSPRFSRRPVEQAMTLPDDLATWERESVVDFRSDTERPPWLADGAGSERTTEAVGDTDFTYWKPGKTDCIAGYSGQEATVSEAEEEARRSAREKLAMLAVMELKRQGLDVDPAALFPLAARYAGNRECFEVKDSVVETRRLSGGSALVSRAAVLVAADKERVNNLAGAVAGEVRRGWLAQQEYNRRALWTVISGVLIAFVVFLLYSLVNAGTKGHFAWPLRIASIAVIAILCYAVYYVRSQLDMF